MPEIPDEVIIQGKRIRVQLGGSHVTIGQTSIGMTPECEEHIERNMYKLWEPDDPRNDARGDKAWQAEYYKLYEKALRAERERLKRRPFDQ